MNRVIQKAEDAHNALIGLGKPLIPVAAVKSDMLIDCKENDITYYFNEIEPDFLVYRLKKAIDLIGMEDFKNFGIREDAHIYDTFTKKNQAVLIQHNIQNPISDELLIEINNSILSRVGSLEIGFCKEGLVFGFKVTDDWYSKLEEFVDVVNKAK